MVGNPRYNKAVDTIQKNAITQHLRKHYAFQSIDAIQPIIGGEQNRNFAIIAGKERFVLRVYSTHHATTGLRKLPEIDCELDFMEAAREHGVPTPPVILTAGDARITILIMEDQPHFATLFGYAQGTEVEKYTPEIARATAQTLLDLRRASLSFRRPSPRPWPGDIARLSLAFYEANHERMLSHKGLLDRLHQSAQAGYAQIESANLPTGVIHGDVKLGNLLVKSGKIRAVIDFDDYRETYLLEEFTRTLMHDLDSPMRNAIRAGQFSIFQTALASDSTVTTGEIAHLGTFLRARLVYDLTAYALAGLDALVDEMLADQSVREVLLSGF